MIERGLLAVHDISCVGRCSLTVALPIISSVGIECSVLPTAVLSTHTGGFTGFTLNDLTDDIVPIMEHWESLELKFSSIYTGFLASEEQIGLVCDVIDRVVHEGGKVYVDPVMADAGKLYSVFDMEFPKKMAVLSKKADVLMPNLTELSFMLGMDYKEGPYTEEYIESMFVAAEEFDLEKIAITGVSMQKGKVGTVFKDYKTGESGYYMKDEIPGYYHGSGDVFGSSLVASLERGLSLSDSVTVATDFTVESIKRTAGMDTRFGLVFEPEISNLVKSVNAKSRK